ncbi:MAG TPA: M48 family metallopeptidase [Tepidisphaeraceae bacterium]|nr:M48 family metallopeptidase [Tepidisphaeraceae bacterium]
MTTMTTQKLHRFVLLSLCAGFLLTAGVGCMASDQKVVQQASAFNDGIKPAEIQQARISPYLQQIGDRIVAAARQCDAEGIGPKTHFAKGDRTWMFQDLHWELVNSKTINAFTTGGHYIYVYDALYQMCKTEDELAAVLAHEYGHIYCRHVQKGTGRQEALAAASLVAAGAGYAYGGSENGAQYAKSASALAQQGGGFLEAGFTRGDEAQADEFGFIFYTRAGWPPEHFADFFKDMIAAGYDTKSAMTSDHPTLASRVEAAEKRVAQLNPQRVAQYRKPDIATQQQFDQYKRDAVAASQGMPNDTQVLQAKNLLQALPRSCWVPYEPDDQKQAWQKIIEDAQKAQQKQQSKSK